MFRRRKKITLVVTVTLLSLGILGWHNIRERTLGRSVGDEQRKFSVENFRGESENILPTQLEIAYLEINSVKYQGPIIKNMSVYDFMNQLQSEGKINFKDKTYIGMGKFIEELNGIRGNGDKFWIYYVNGKKAKIGVSNYKISPGDVVSWKYEKDMN